VKKERSKIHGPRVVNAQKLGIDCSAARRQEHKNVTKGIKKKLAEKSDLVNHMKRIERRTSVGSQAKGHDREKMFQRKLAGLVANQRDESGILKGAIR